MPESAIEPAPDASYDGGLFAGMEFRQDQDQVVQTMPPAGPPKPAEYQFDPGNALAVALFAALAAFIWFARRRIKWLVAKGCDKFSRIIRWLHMPPDGKI